MHFILGDDWRIFDRLTRFRLSLDRQILGEWFVRNDHGSGMNTVLATQAFEPLGNFHDPGDVSIR